MSMRKEQEDPKIKEVLEYLIKRSGKTIKEVSEESGIPYQTLYSIVTRASSRTSLRTLKILADYFHEDLTIFLGLYEYDPPLALSDKEKKLLKDYRSLADPARARVDEAVRDAVNGVRPIVLTSKEQSLLRSYRSLTDTSQDRIGDAVEDALSNPKNCRHGHEAVAGE